MKGKNFVVINGRHYDAVTGVAISDTVLAARVDANKPRPTKAFHDIGPAKKPASPDVARSRTSTAHTVHIKPQKSQTLYRAALKKPATYAAPSAVRSPLITKFGPQNSHIKPAMVPVSSVAAAKPVAHAGTHAVKSLHTPAKHIKPAAPAVTRPSPRDLKEHLLKEGLANAQRNTGEHKAEGRLKRMAGRQSKFASIATMSLATIMLGGYLTYVNMPNLSVRVASARAGVDAQFPEYSPDGYSFAGPVAYAPGEVTINFKGSGGQQAYEIKQKTSNWDSQAVLDNFITRETNSYLTYSEQGLTVYTYENRAAWVSGGVLYTIDSKAPLSSQQILRIAGSM